MAITTYSAPDVVTNLGTPILYRVLSSSTDVTTVIQLKLYYRRSEDDFYTLASTSIQSKVIGKDYFEFNLSGALSKLLTSDYQTGSTAFKTQCENSAIEYVVKFTEYYPSSAFVAVGTITYATGFYFVNTQLYKTETQSVYTGSDWYMDGAGSHKFLTDSPSTQYIRASERVQLGMITSYTDPVIKVRETKNNGSNATVMYELPDANYQFYLWNWEIDENNVVTILPSISGLESNIVSLSATSFYKYMNDGSGTMYGGVRLVGNNDILEISLPYLPLITSASLNIYHMAVTNTVFTWEIYYFYSGAWNASASNPQTSSLSVFTLKTQVMPSGTTAVRIKKIGAGQELWVSYAYVSYLFDNVLHKRCQFTLDTTHIDSDTNKLEIWAESTSSSSTVISEVKTFVVDKTPTSQDTTRFAVKNKRGDFDHFTYTEGHSEILTAEKTRSRRELPNTFTTKDRGLTVDKVVSEKIFTCYSRYIEEAELQWWATIIESDEVYVIVNDVRYAVDIVTDSVISYTHTDLVQLKIDWTYAVTR